MNREEGTGNGKQGTGDRRQGIEGSTPEEARQNAEPILGEGTVVPTAEEWDEEPNAELGSLSYRQLVWRKFRKSKLALLGMVVLFLFYFTALFAEFFAPYLYTRDDMRMRYVPPQ